MDSFILAESNWKAIKNQQIDLAVLPWGATEAHNYHLPYSTDNIMVEKIATEAARLACSKGSKVMILPLIPFGVNTGQLDIKLDINLNPDTQYFILKDIITVLNRQKIQKFLILNGHGGNDFKQMIRQLGSEFPEMFICTCNWFQSFETSEFFENGGGHADEMETSIMQFICPELVLPMAEAGAGIGKKFRISSLNQKWTWAERRWSQVTSDTGIGDPSKASAEKGERCFNEVVKRVGNFLTELCKADVKDMYV